VIDFLDQQAFPVKFPSHRIELLKSDRPGIALLEMIRDCRLVVLIDAMQAGLRVGTVRCLSTAEMRGSTVAVSSHDFGIKSALAIGEAIGDTSAPVEVIGIEIGAQHNMVYPEPRDLDNLAAAENPIAEGTTSRGQLDTAVLVRLLTDVMRRHGITGESD
jgi:hydrogenase maturation protease